jgi:hypothetical protein
MGMRCTCGPTNLPVVTSAKRVRDNYGTDVGTVRHPGSVQYDPQQRSYLISGSGENMWFTADAFQFAWKKVSGDVSLTAF